MNPSLQPIRWTERETALHSPLTLYLRKEVREHSRTVFIACTQAFFSPPFADHLTCSSPFLSSTPSPFLSFPIVSFSVPCLHSSHMCCDPVAVTVPGTVNKAEFFSGIIFSYSQTECVDDLSHCEPAQINSQRGSDVYEINDCKSLTGQISVTRQQAVAHLAQTVQNRRTDYPSKGYLSCYQCGWRMQCVADSSPVCHTNIW